MRKLIFVVVAGDAQPARVHFFGRLSFLKGFVRSGGSHRAAVRRFERQIASPMKDGCKTEPL
ncbi:MAG: hypothetical protein ABSD44_01605 [Terracidiphilus sp.]